MTADRYVESVFADYRYYGVCENRQDLTDLDSAHGLIRVPEAIHDEQYDGQGGWSYSSFDDRSYDHFVPVSKAGADHIARRLDRQWDGWTFHVVSERGRPFAVVRTKDHFVVEYTGYHNIRWSGQDATVLARLPHQPAWQSEVTEVDNTLDAMATVTRQRRERDRDRLTAGYALFNHHVDVLDLGSAYAVAQEPGQGIAMPLNDHEMNRLRPRLFVRDARHNAELVDGHYYFAVFRSLEDCVAIGNAYSLMRCTPDEKHWELCVREDEWPPTYGPQLRHVVPIGRTDLARVVPAIAADTRILEVISPELGTVARIRLTPGEEPDYKLRQWRHKPTWVVWEPERY